MKSGDVRMISHESDCGPTSNGECFLYKGALEKSKFKMDTCTCMVYLRIQKWNFGVPEIQNELLNQGMMLI